MQEFLYRLYNCPVRQWPYPHFYLEQCFGDQFYSELLANLPEQKLLRQIGDVRGKALKKYPERFAFGLDKNSLIALSVPKLKFWRDVSDFLGSPTVVECVASKFGISGAGLRADALLVQDTVNYALGPHTDAVSKVVSLLFYLPADSDNAHLGTSVYVPRAGFKPDGTDHYDRAGFDLVATMPYQPNALFGFPRSDHSFHGVEPIKDDTRRWLLQYNLYAA